MLSDDDRALLDFEGRHWKYAGAKEAQIREQLGISATRYYARLNWLIDQYEALAYNPLLVRRLQRQRDLRAQARAAKRARFQ